MYWDLPKKIAAAIAGIVAIGGAAWAFGDDSGYRPVIKREFVGFITKEFRLAQEQINQLAQGQQWIELTNLENRYNTGILDDMQKQRRCELAYQLRAWSVRDCTWPSPVAQQ